MGYAAYELEEQLRQDLVQSLEEYAALQGSLLKRTQRAGTFLSGYLLLTVSSQVGSSCLSVTDHAYTLRMRICWQHSVMLCLNCMQGAWVWWLRCLLQES